MGASASASGASRGASRTPSNLTPQPTGFSQTAGLSSDYQ